MPSLKLEPPVIREHVGHSFFLTSSSVPTTTPWAELHYISMYSQLITPWTKNNIIVIHDYAKGYIIPSWALRKGFLMTKYQYYIFWIRFETVLYENESIPTTGDLLFV